MGAVVQYAHAVIDREAVAIYRVPKYLWAPSKGRESEEDPMVADPPVASQSRPKPTKMLSRRIVYSIYYNSTLLLPYGGDGERSC